MDTDLPHERGRVCLLLAAALDTNGEEAAVVLEWAQRARDQLRQAGAAAQLDLARSEAFRPGR